jgi:hypothetical protein
VNDGTARDPSDPRLETLAGVVARAGAGVCWLARLATRASLVGALAGAVLWWALAGERVDEWWRGTAGSLLVLALCLAAPLWLLNVRFALIDLIELPERLRGVARRRAGRFRARPAPERPDGGALAAVRSIRDLVSDYGDVAGSWGTVAQLVVPMFWALTLGALAAVPVLVTAAAIAGLAEL